jgi:hypothetical protein
MESDVGKLRPSCIEMKNSYCHLKLLRKEWKHTLMLDLEDILKFLRYITEERNQISILSRPLVLYFRNLTLKSRWPSSMSLSCTFLNTYTNWHTHAHVITHIQNSYTCREEYIFIYKKVYMYCVLSHM